ncbi:MAG TPA: AAA family ATPase [Candidatus Acidoferrales bacterium]|nr:AAA family ATPase [Candidatus Acidoferrales bacterium]
MIVVAGPPGSGKSTAFPVSGFGVPFFNADDRAAALNRGSYAGISRQIRQQVNLEYERFVIDCIQRRQSFAIETTLRSHVTFDQARLAKGMGFAIEMRYLALVSFELHLERVKARADAGGHSASEATLRGIHNASLGNLPRATEETDELWIYDNSKLGGPPRLIMEAKAGAIIFLEEPPPAWLARVFGWV